MHDVRMLVPVQGARGDAGPKTGLTLRWQAPRTEVRACAPTCVPDTITDRS